MEKANINGIELLFWEWNEPTPRALSWSWPITLSVSTHDIRVQQARRVTDDVMTWPHMRVTSWQVKSGSLKRIIASRPWFDSRTLFPCWAWVSVSMFHSVYTLCITVCWWGCGRMEWLVLGRWDYFQVGYQSNMKMSLKICLFVCKLLTVNIRI